MTRRSLQHELLSRDRWYRDGAQHVADGLAVNPGDTAAHREISVSVLYSVIESIMDSSKSIIPQFSGFGATTSVWPLFGEFPSLHSRRGQMLMYSQGTGHSRPVH